MNRKKVAVGLSGGVDSAVSAWLLKEQGYEVVGVHLYCWPPKSEYEKEGVSREEWIKKNGCRADEDRQSALKTALEIGIPFKVLDFSEEYNQKVIDYFYEEYKNGRTPNPDVLCNSEIKFGLFLKWALENGFDYVATGHYAKIVISSDLQARARMPRSMPGVSARGLANQTESSCLILDEKIQTLSDLQARARMPRSMPGVSARGLANQTESSCLILDEKIQTSSDLQSRARMPRSMPGVSARGLANQTELVKLMIPKDKHKDQTYFLWKLTQNELKHVLFPLGEYLKSEVREVAKKAGLGVASKKDSQGICFVGNVEAREFLAKRLAKKEGFVFDTKGNKVGIHDGVWFYTIGQRGGWKMDPKFQKKIVSSGETPIYYVVEKRAEDNSLVVGTDVEVLADSLVVEGVSLVTDKKLEGRLGLRIRHGGEIIEGVISDSGDGLTVILDKQIRGLASGQSAVFYDGEECLGGGVIK